LPQRSGKGKFQRKLLDRIIFEAEAIAKQQLVVLLGRIVVEELLSSGECVALEELKGEGVVGLKVPFYLRSDGVVENVDDREEYGDCLVIGEYVRGYEGARGEDCGGP
jgi:hypothetical protein